MIKNTLFFLVFLFSEVNIHKSNTYILFSPTKIGVWNITAYAQLQCDHSNRKPSSSLHIRHTSTHLHSWETGLVSCLSPNRELPLTVFLYSVGHSCAVVHHLVTTAKVFWAHWPKIPSAIVFALVEEMRILSCTGTHPSVLLNLLCNVCKGVRMEGALLEDIKYDN